MMTPGLSEQELTLVIIVLVVVLVVLLVCAACYLCHRHHTTNKGQFHIWFICFGFVILEVKT